MSVRIFEEILRLKREGVAAALATVVEAKGSTPAQLAARMIVPAGGRPLGTVGGGCVEADVVRAARDVLDTGRPRLLKFRLSGEEAERTGIACGGTLSIMIESLEEDRLILVGAGHVGQAVARLAHTVGFHVTVVDDRPDYANRQRFPDADEISLAELDALGETLRVGRLSFLLIMTRGHAEDLTVLRWAVTTKALYIGVLGSRSKRIKFQSELKALGVPDRVFERLHMPVGLDIGAENVEEIAIAIVAELIACKKARGAPHG